MGNSDYPNVETLVGEQHWLQPRSEKINDRSAVHLSANHLNIFNSFDHNFEWALPKL